MALANDAAWPDPLATAISHSSCLMQHVPRDTKSSSQPSKKKPVRKLRPEAPLAVHWLSLGELSKLIDTFKARA